MLKPIASFIRVVTSNIVSMFGTALTTSSAGIFLVLFGIDFIGIHPCGPYFVVLEEII